MALIDIERLEREAESLAQTFASAHPFPHMVVEQFLHPEAAERLLQSYPAIEETTWDNSTTYKHQKGKFVKQSIQGTPMAPFFEETASPRLLDVLSRITGIQQLEPDPELFGAGLHQSLSGGFLDVHVDFNLHPTTQHYRRLNLLVYMNKEWQESYGGYLELWDMDKRQCVKSIAPLFNRAVLFETSEISYHGHPHPLRLSPGVTRKSLSVYYYTVEKGERISPTFHNTRFQNTQGLAGAVKVAKSSVIAGLERLRGTGRDSRKERSAP